MQYRLVVRDAGSLQVLQLYTCVDQIQHVEWSADSLFLLCALYRRGLVQVRCRVRAGAASRQGAQWGGTVLWPLVWRKGGPLGASFL